MATTIKLTALASLGAEAGELFLTEEQLGRLQHRNCVVHSKGKKKGTVTLTEPVHFKAGEDVTFVGEVPKYLSGKYQPAEVPETPEA